MNDRFRWFAAIALTVSAVVLTPVRVFTQSHPPASQTGDVFAASAGRPAATPMTLPTNVGTRAWYPATRETRR